MLSIPNLFYIEYMAILTFEQKHDFWKRPFNLSTQNQLCIEYDHLDLSRHDLGKTLLFCPSKIYCALRGVPRIWEGGGQEFFFQIWEFACREAMRIVRGVRGHAPPRNFFKTVQFGAF